MTQQYPAFNTGDPPKWVTSGGSNKRSFFKVPYVHTDAGEAKYGKYWNKATADQRQARWRDGMMGQGGYWDWTSPNQNVRRKFWNNAIGKNMTRYIEGNPIQAMEDAALLGGAVAGMGDYQIEANSLIQGGTGAHGDADLIYSRQEYIGDLVGSNTFALQSWFINPGNAQLFPFLSQIANDFDQFQWLQLVFFTKTTMGDISTTNASLGTIMGVVEYDVQDNVFNNKQELLECFGSVSAVISKDMIIGVECDPSQNASIQQVMFTTPATSTSSLPANSDPKTYFSGILEIAVQGTMNTGQICELWVHYSVRLMKPQLFTGLGGNIAMAEAQFNVNTNVPTGLSANGSNGLLPAFIGSSAGPQSGSTNVLAGTSTANILAYLSNATDCPAGVQANAVMRLLYSIAGSATYGGFGIRFPDNLSYGTYRVAIQLQGTGMGGSTNSQAPTTTGVQNCVQTGATTSTPTITASTFTQYTTSCIVQITNSAYTAGNTLTGGTYVFFALTSLIYASITGYQVMVTQVPDVAVVPIGLFYAI